MSSKRLLSATVAIAACLALSAGLGSAAGAAGRGNPGPPPDRAAKAATTDVQILGLNDFHGALQPPSGSGGRIGATLAGGAEYLATHVENLRATNPNTLFVSAGDLIGATPLVSALFHDEPTIEAFNLMELDYNGVGNHEFDEGVDELLRMQHGGCHPEDGCQDGDPFGGADFGFLAANVAYKDNGETIFPPYAIEKFPGGVKVALIGMTLEGTPQIVTPAGISTVDFFDEADSVNALVPELQRQGVETFVVLLHQGGSVSGGLDETTINSCNQPSGPLPPIVERMDDAIDVVVTGHTNWAVNCEIDGKIVTGAASNGRLVTDIDLTVSRATKDVVAATVNNTIVTRTVDRAPALTSLIDKYDELSAPLANRVVGSITTDITRSANAAGESAYGDVIADAQLAATALEALGGSVVAFMNPGGIRENLVFDNQAGGEEPGEVTYGELFTTQPFNNVLTVLTCTGAQVEALLEQQLFTGRMLQVSEGFSYSWDANGAEGNRIDPATIQIGGTPIDLGADYRITTNNFLATGGDGFSVFTECTDPLGGEIDLDALVAYFEANSPVAPGPQDRITRLG